ncbi:hypothetical protein LUZ60_010520 [Juncus effusus]|nr:hypothetical protein LUZ60_010520 [Juncus effusus]
MLRFLAFHARSVTTSANRRASKFSQPTPQSSTNLNRPLINRNIPSFLLQTFSIYRLQSYKTLTRTQHKSRLTNLFHTVSISNQSTFKKRLNLISFLKFSPLNRISHAITLSLTRYQLVPTIFTIAYSRQLAFSEPALAENGYFNSIKPSQSILSSILSGVFLVFRIIYLSFLFFPAIITSPFSTNPQFRKTWLDLVHKSLERAGPAFIKWGQWAATRPDLFPKDLCVQLAKLHSTAPAHEFWYSKYQVEKAFGRKIEEIFESFDELPVASGSIAQVHRAILKGKATQVAVKIRHPNIEQSIKVDFKILNLIAKISTMVPGLHWLRLDESVRQFATFMLSQVDLSREAAHLSRFSYNFRNWKNISFPEPIYPFVHPCVLVESFEDGEMVSRFFEGIGESGNEVLRRDLARTGTYAFLKMLLEDNFIHGDMHPGNILVRIPMQNRKRMFWRKKPEVVFLDVGLTAELAKNDRANLRTFFKAVALRDGRTAAECTLRLSTNQSCPNPEAFANEMERMFAFWGTPEGDVYHPVECMQQLLETVRRNKVNVDGNVCTVLVTILVLEGWQRKLDPEFDIMSTLKTLLLENEMTPAPHDWIFS